MYGFACKLICFDFFGSGGFFGLIHERTNKWHYLLEHSENRLIRYHLLHNAASLVSIVLVL